MVSQREERTLSVHNEHELLLKLEKAGLSDELAQKVIASKDNELVEPTSNQKSAREIMGKNFFGVEEAIKYFGVNPSRRQLVLLSEVPFSEAVLEECKETHVLVAVIPLSILEIREKVHGKELFYDQDWYDDELFAKEKGEIGWQLTRKTPIDNSFSKNWKEQLTLITEDDEVPTAQVMVYTIIGHYLATGECLFKDVYVRTSSVDSDGRRVRVGYFYSGGLRVGGHWDVNRDGSLGLVSSRRS